MSENRCLGSGMLLHNLCDNSSWELSDREQEKLRITELWETSSLCDIEVKNHLAAVSKWMRFHWCTRRSERGDTLVCA